MEIGITQYLFNIFRLKTLGDVKTGGSRGDLWGYTFFFLGGVPKGEERRRSTFVGCCWLFGAVAQPNNVCGSSLGLIL